MKHTHTQAHTWCLFDCDVHRQLDDGQPQKDV